MNPSLLERLNALPDDEAFAALRTCCHSSRWARALAARRPFASADELLAAADELWSSSTDEDLTEAFAGHPRIGERHAQATQSTQAQTWSSGEQSGMNRADDDLRARIARGNQAYEQKFGHIYLVCASGRSADELLALLEQRLHHDPSHERQVAREEQRKILRLRLQKLLTP